MLFKINYRGHKEHSVLKNNISLKLSFCALCGLNKKGKSLCVIKLTTKFTKNFIILSMLS